MIRLDIHVEKESRRLLYLFENNAESWPIFNRLFRSLSKDYLFFSFLVYFSYEARAEYVTILVQYGKNQKMSSDRIFIFKSLTSRQKNYYEPP